MPRQKSQTQSKEFYSLPVTQKELSSFSTTIFEFSSDAMLVLDAVGKITAVNTALTNLIGFERDELLGHISDFLFAGQSDVSSYKNFIRDLVNNGYWSGQVFGRNRSGQIIPMDIHFSAVYDELGQANHYVGICSSMYSYISKMNEFPFDPNIDPLTKIYNANAFLHRLEHNIHKIEKDLSVLSILYIDVDHFHELASRDNYQAGDIILKNLGQSLKDMLEQSDTVAHLKSDIFCVIIQDVFTQESIEEVANRIFANITKPYTLHPNIAKVSLSIGVSTFPISGTTPQDLLSSAADAAKRAKSKGGNQIFYHKRLNDPLE